MERRNRLALSEENDSLLVSFMPYADDHLLPSERLRTSARVFDHTMRKQRPLARVESEASSFRFEATKRAPIEAALPDLDRRISAILDAPLTPSMVNEILLISSQERIRWAKDGRLPPSGTTPSRRGPRSYSVLLFSVSDVLYLARNPGVIDEWRRQDRADETSRSSVCTGDEAISSAA